MSKLKGKWVNVSKFKVGVRQGCIVTVVIFNLCERTTPLLNGRIVLEYVRETEDARVKGLRDVRMRCIDRCRWRHFCHDYPLEGV